MNKFFNWWMQEVMVSSRNPSTGELIGGAAALMIATAIGLVVLMFLLALIVASKGIILLVAMVVGGIGYALYLALKQATDA